MFAARGCFLCLALAAPMLVPAAAPAQTFQTLYSFTGAADGGTPLGAVFDGSGNLYGTTCLSCTGNKAGPTGGTVFKLAPPAKGHTRWSETTLHSFTGAADGEDPYAGVTFINGKLYGTAAYGGHANSTSCRGGCGTVFELDPATKNLTTLHIFTGKAQSGGPYTGAALDTNGALYGTTEGGDGASGNTNGAVFKLTPPAKGKTVWTFATLYTFSGGADGSFSSTLVIDKTGNLYGMTKYGGNLADCNGEGCGTVFKLDPLTGNLTTLHTFTGGGDGGTPSDAGLTGGYLTDDTFVLYGMTTQGGADNAGTVFALDPTTQELTTLHAFTGGADGGNARGTLALDAQGMLYGETLSGGVKGCYRNLGCGAAFKLDPTTQALTTLHAFAGGAGGGNPLGGLALDAQGAVYGTTAFGGDVTSCPGSKAVPAGCGTVFKITP